MICKLVLWYSFCLFVLFRDIKLQSNDLRNCFLAQQQYYIFLVTIWTITSNTFFFFVLFFKPVGGKTVRATLLSQIYVTVLTTGSGFKSWQGSQIGKEKKGRVKWGLITIFYLPKNMFEEASDVFDTLSLWRLPKGRNTCWKEEEVLLMWERHRTTE